MKLLADKTKTRTVLINIYHGRHWILHKRNKLVSCPPSFSASFRTPAKPTHFHAISQLLIIGYRRNELNGVVGPYKTIDGTDRKKEAQQMSIMNWARNGAVFAWNRNCWLSQSLESNFTSVDLFKDFLGEAFVASLRR